MQTIEFNEKLEFLFKPARLTVLDDTCRNKRSGVYGILNLVNGKIYVGSAVNINVRRRQHKSELTLAKHANKYLQQSYNKHGSFAFEFLILEYVSCKSNLLDREDHWIALTNSCDPLCGYNISKKAGSSLGIKRSELTKLRMSNCKKAQSERLNLKPIYLKSLRDESIVQLL